MSQATLEELRTLSRSVIENGPLAAMLRDVRIETPDDDYNIVVRVIITVTDPDAIELGDASRTKRDLERAIAEADDRVPSIRFAEAA